MTLAGFYAAVDGFAKANGTHPNDEISDGEYLAALAEEMRAGRA